MSVFLGSANWLTIVLSLAFWAAVVWAALWMVQRLFPDVRHNAPSDVQRKQS